MKSPKNTISAQPGESPGAHYRRLIADGFSEHFAANMSGYHPVSNFEQCIANKPWKRFALWLVLYGSLSFILYQLIVTRIIH